MNILQTQRLRKKTFEIIQEYLPDDIESFMFAEDRLIGILISEEWRLQLLLEHGKMVTNLCLRPLNKGISFIPGYKDKTKFYGLQNNPQLIAKLFVEEFLRCKKFTPTWKFNKSLEECQEYISKQPGAKQIWVLPDSTPYYKHVQYNHD